MEDERELFHLELVTLLHKPVHAPRPDILGEAIYLEAWKRFLARPVEWGDGELNEVFGSIFYDIVVTDWQRISTVAASFMSWLGTNCGSSFIHQAKKDCDDAERRDWQKKYFLRWCLENKRTRGINGGQRTCEAILGHPKMMTIGGLAYDLPKLSTSDIETLDNCAYWLGSLEGQAMIEEAEAEITATREAVYKRQDMLRRAEAKAAELVKEKNDG